MKRTMKRGLLVLLACIFSLGLLAAAPVTARADGVPAISGSSGAETTFYLYASSSGYVKLEATRGAAYVMNYDFYGNYTGSGAEEMYGFYRVTITKAGTPAKTYIWAPSAALNTYGTETRSSILVTFSGYGDYKVTVTPLMKNEINNYFPQERFQYWQTDPTWTLTTQVNCTCYQTGDSQTQPTAAPQTQPPVPASAAVTVRCVSSSGQTLRTYNETITSSRMIYPQAIDGYTATSAGQYVSFSNGYASPNALTFYYQPTPTSATLTVYCYDTSGQLIRTYQETLAAGQTVYPRQIQGYTINSAGQWVSVNGGVCSPQKLDFYYRKDAVAVQVPVSCYDTNGNLLQTYQESVSSSKMIYPRAITGYITPQSGVYVTYTNGTCSPASVMFTYGQAAVPATVTVNCYDQNGNLLRTYTESLTASKTIYPQTFSGYTSPQGGQYVTYANGTCSPASVNFTYTKIPTPAQVQIRCYDQNGTLLKAYTETISSSRSFSPPSIVGYSAVSGPASVTYADGAANPAAISFTYQLNSVPVPPSSNPNVVVPLSWDTQFKPGTAKAVTNGKLNNEERVKNLPFLYDDDYTTSFNWTYWKSERNDDIPEFTAYFDGDTISSIGVRNGKTSSTSQFNRCARVRSITVDIYTRDGQKYTHTISLSESYSRDYTVRGLGGTYTNVDHVDLWVVGIKSGDTDTYEVHISDIQFYK